MVLQPAFCAAAGAPRGCRHPLVTAMDPTCMGPGRHRLQSLWCHGWGCFSPAVAVSQTSCRDGHCPPTAHSCEIPRLLSRPATTTCSQESCHHEHIPRGMEGAAFCATQEKGFWKSCWKQPDVATR